MLRLYFSIFFILVILICVLWRGNIPRGSIDIPNFHKVDEYLYRSGQPSPTSFGLLDKLGIGDVLSLRFYHRSDKRLERAGIRRHHIATKASKIGIEEIKEALRIIRNSEGPVLVHCWHGSDRTGIVVAFYKMVFHGISKEQAIEDLTNGGFGFHAVFGNLVETIRQADIDSLRAYFGVTRDMLSVPTHDQVNMAV